MVLLGVVAGVIFGVLLGLLVIFCLRKFKVAKAVRTCISSLQTLAIRKGKWHTITRR